MVAKTEGNQLVMVSYCGLDNLSYRTAKGLSAVSESSTTLYGSHTREQLYTGIDLIITLFLHSPEGAAFTKQDLNPISSIQIFPSNDTSIQLGVTLELQNGRTILLIIRRVRELCRYNLGRAECEV